MHKKCYNIHINKAPARLTSPEARPKEVRSLSEVSLPRSGDKNGGEASPKRCAECGCSSHERALTAPHRNARGYTGPMYCLSCNPRFADGDETLRWMIR